MRKINNNEKNWRNNSNTPCMALLQQYVRPAQKLINAFNCKSMDFNYTIFIDIQLTCNLIDTMMWSTCFNFFFLNWSQNDPRLAIHLKFPHPLNWTIQTHLSANHNHNTKVIDWTNTKKKTIWNIVVKCSFPRLSTDDDDSWINKSVYK